MGEEGEERFGGKEGVLGARVEGEVKSECRRRCLAVAVRAGRERGGGLMDGWLFGRMCRDMHDKSWKIQLANFRAAHENRTEKRRRQGTWESYQDQNQRDLSIGRTFAPSTRNQTATDIGWKDSSQLENAEHDSVSRNRT